MNTMNKKKRTKSKGRNKTFCIQLELPFSAEDRLQMLIYDQRHIKEQDHEMYGDKRLRNGAKRAVRKGGKA